jgi:all-trans-retinol dehydrogenase (NAD+)
MENKNTKFSLNVLIRKLISGLITQFSKQKLLQLLALITIYNIIKEKGLLPKKSIKGEHVFITGGGSGLGRRLSILLGKQYANISVADINLEGAEETVKAIRNRGFTGQALFCDVSKEDSVKSSLKTAEKAFGPITMLINNAGIVTGKSLLNSPLSLLKKTIEINLISHFHTLQHTLPEMLSRNHGHIITICSAAGLAATKGLADYSASKFGVFGLNESVRVELNSRKNNKVKTTCVCPFFINTGMFAGVRTKFPFLLPILEEKYAAQRIVSAIVQEEEVLVMPVFVKSVMLLRALVPPFVFDKVLQFFGLNAAMDHFVGRSAVKSAKL